MGDIQWVILIVSVRKYICRERSEVTLYIRPFIFNGIPMLLILLHGDLSRPYRRVGMGWGGSEKQLLDGFHRMEASSAKQMYFEFHDHTFIGEFSTAIVSFDCKGVMYLVDSP